MKAVLLVIFNRPDTTKEVLSALRANKPGRVYVSCDGPRPGNGTDPDRISRTIKTVERELDWPCDIRYRILENNLGCKDGVSSAISWLFENEEDGIILEDDCVPGPDFLPYCAELLDRYKDVDRVGHIGGYNCQYGRRRGGASYYFSQYFHVWGWATWRRAWKGYDPGIVDLDSFLAERSLEKLFSRPSIRSFWEDNFRAATQPEFNTWDYQWVYQNFMQDRLAVVPQANLIRNIGFGSGATHTGTAKVRIPPLERLDFPLRHPSSIIPDREADDFTYRHELGMGRFHDLKHGIKKILGLDRGRR